MERQLTQVSSDPLLQPFATARLTFRNRMVHAPTTMNMSDDRAARVFRSLYDVCAEQIPPVDLMVCLSASNELIIDRIRLRRRDFELELDPDYYLRLNRIYEEFFARYSGPKLHVSMDEHDFVRSPQLFSILSAQIDAQPLGSAT